VKSGSEANTSRSLSREPGWGCRSSTSTPAALTWNAWNVPVSVNSTTATYDALGRMVETGSGTTYKQFVFRPSGANLAVYSGSLIKGVVPLPGGAAAIYGSTGLNYIRHTDWLGSSRLAITWTHAIYSKESYAPFGEAYNESGTPDRSFTNQDQDVATGSLGSGVYDFLFRKYDPSAGRWLSPDPSGWAAVEFDDPQSLDRYAYVENQPLSLVDPAGLFMAPPSPCPVSVWISGCDYPVQPSPGCTSFSSCPGNPGNSGGGTTGPTIPYNLCVAAALYNELSSIKSLTDKANSDLKKTYGLGAVLIGPAAAVKYGIGGSAISLNGLITSFVAGIFVKTYFITLPSWVAGFSQAESQFQSDVKACGGS
jgi:RHS repeat-associated protein